jgi:hypothetical protein
VPCADLINTKNEVPCRFSIPGGCMKRVLAVVGIAFLTVPLAGGVGPRSKCDNEVSRLCDGLVAVYQFEEGLSAASTPTYPDAVRRNSFGLGDLYEPDAVDVGAGSTLAGYNNGKLGKNSNTYIQPSDISGLKLWLKADAITGINEGGTIQTWSDSSGNGNNFTQPTSGLRPTYRTGVLNGKPVVRFDGTDDVLDGPYNNALISATAHTAFVVFKRTSGTLKATLLRAGNASYDGVWEVCLASPNLRNVNGGVVTKSASNGAFRIATSNYNGTSVRAGVTDTRDASLSSVSATGGASTASVGMGGSPTGSTYDHYLNGDIAEAIVYNVSLSETDRKKVESYLADKYNIAIPYEPVGAAAVDDPDAVEFDGLSQYLHTGMNGRGSGVLGNSPWTVAFWMYADPGTAGNDAAIWSEKGLQNGAVRLGTEIEINYATATTVTPKVRVYDGLTEASTTVTWGSAVSTGAFHLVVATFRPRTLFTNGELSISVDGGAKVTAPISGNGGVVAGVGSVIGRRADPTDPDFFDVSVR